jgi:hypothetical protein
MTAEISNRAKVRLWVRDQIKDREEVHIPTIAEDGVRALSKDRRFLAALASEMLRDMIYDLARQEISHTRGFIQIGDSAVDREGLQKRVRAHNVFRGWLEHVGDKHVRLLEMTHEDLMVAADEREKRGTHEIEIAALWRTIANQLEGGQTVGSRFSEEEIDRMYSGLNHS